MRAILAMAVWLGLGGSAAPSDEAHFDLFCTGKTESQDAMGEMNRSEYRTRLRMDLAKKRYCADDCTLIGAIKEVTDDVITIQRTNEDKDPRLPTSKFIIVRSNGALEMSTFPRRGGVEFQNTTATCEKVDYSGIPDQKKF